MPEYRRHYDDDYRRGGRRDWSDRASDEVRSWFGDDEARARRGNDERNDRYPYGGERDRGWSGGDRWNGERPWGGDRQYYDRGAYGDRPYGSSYGERDRSSFVDRDRDRGWRDHDDDRGSRDRFTQGRGYQERGVDQDRLYRGGDRSTGRSFSDPGSRWVDDRGDGWMQDDYNYRGGARGADRDDEGAWASQGGRSYGRGTSQGSGGWMSGGASSRESYSGRGPKDYKRSDDRIREEISDRLTDDHGVDASEITVQVQGGEVTLSGSVPTREQKRRAEDLAEWCSGVSDVTNSLRVQKAGQTSSSASSGSTQVSSQGGKSGRSTTGTSA